MSAISQLLLTRFWPNFKGRFLRPFGTDLTVTVTFVQATFVLATFVHIKNISAVTDLTLTNFIGHNFGGHDLFWSKNFWTIFCLTQSFLDLQMFLDTKFKKVSTQNFFRSQNFVKPKLCWPIIGSKLFWTKFFLDLIISWPKKHKFNKNFFGPNSFCTQNFAYICFD